MNPPATPKGIAMPEQDDSFAPLILAGPTASGKTALALAWLHRLRPDFPGGQLYADLGAQSPTGPADPGEVLGGFLRGLGVEPQQVPYGIAERAALYRSLTAERRIVVLLDDAATAARTSARSEAGAGSHSCWTEPTTAR